jgi:prophage antirepressor-like protein
VFTDEVKIVHPIPDAMGRVQDTIFIHESAFTFLVSRFRTEAEKKLNRFIHKELLPTIRKTGGYISSTATKEQLEGLQLQIKQQQAQIELLSAENKLLENYSDQLGFGEIISNHLAIQR